jgi:hypothetical protein
MTTNLSIILQARAYDDDYENTISIIFGIVVLVVVGIIIYFLTRNKSRKVSYAFIGAILGIPLSYYFQNGLVQLMFGGVSGYITNIDKILNNGNMLGNVIMSVVIFAIVGGVIGFFVDSSGAKKKL